MVNRRRFLGATGLSMLTVSTGFQFPHQPSAQGADVSVDRIKQKARLKCLKNRLLGYPINMNKPSAEFFRWRNELCSAGIDCFAFNNVGNPFKESPIPYSTHDFERDTILDIWQVVLLSWQ